MKKFLFTLTVILTAMLVLLFSGCDSEINTGNSTLSTQYQSTSQETTKYPPATVPTQSSSQQSSTQPPMDVFDSISAEDITDEKMAQLITQKYLSVHPNSRPGYKLEKLENIVVHYVANPGTSALQNWKYFENKNNASAHFIIDLDGSILQCMPLDEVAWAIGTQEGNYSTISIECCHPDKTGKFTDATYESLVKLVSWLCQKYGFTADHVKRHYDYPRQNGWQKPCPIYFVEHPDKWNEFKDDLLIP